MSSAVRVARYLRTWLADRADLRVGEIELDRGGLPIPATLYRPPPATAALPLPSWVVLHGITRPGRSHAQLVRFARALSSTGAAVVVPEVPEWVALDVAPSATVPTVRAALDALPAFDDIDATTAGLVGFSFGAPQAVAASGDRCVKGRVAGVVAFGGYADLEETIRFQLTGRHASADTAYQHRPDPYGRWIVAGNYLQGVPGMEERGDVAGALLELARVAGDRGVLSWDPSLDPIKTELRGGVAPRAQDLYDLLVHGPDRPLDLERANELAKALAQAGRARDPAIDAAARFASVARPVHILHGRNDHLIPFTQARRLAAALPAEVERTVTVTRLFGHSAQDPFPWFEGPRESVMFLRALAEMLDLV